MNEDTQQLVFETPGLIDLRAFTVMGFNAKPATENPIGYFGTGLKYAISVLCRLGTKPVVWIGQDKYTFYTKTVDFRGKAFEQIWMRSQRWKLRARNAELPYTTEYGKNWQPWMVFRELESNTRDEHGRSYLAPAVEAGLEGFTIITIDNPEVVAAFNERDKVFLDPEKQPLVVGDGVVTVRQGDIVGALEQYHEAVNHGREEWVRGDVHTNSIEGFWSQMKRSIDGTHQDTFLPGRH